jgi:hypothetical protein
LDGEGLLQDKIILIVLIMSLLASTLFNVGLIVPNGNADSPLPESQIVGMVNGTNVYNYDLELEKIAFNHTLSKYSFRSAGSSGANATADWIKEQFESFGLEAYKEPFQFANWELLSKPRLVIDDDGNFSTTEDQIDISSFQSAHYSWPTMFDGVFADLVVLPLPPAASYYEIGVNPINILEWNEIDTTDKILVIGREVRWDYTWELWYKNKLTAQPPAAVVHTWWYNWMSFVPNFFSGAGGRPGSTFESYYWNLQIPVGFVNYEDGLWIRNRENNHDVSAKAHIESSIGYGPHYNVIGKLNGFKHPDKLVIISGHYDTVMCSGFCDNGAGTAGVIELARIFSQANRTGVLRPKYTMLFIGFASEEIGLVGSVNYVKEHKDEMSDIIAVINMDSIGSDDFYITETSPGQEFDLDELMLTAAQDLEVNATLESAEGGSDEATFLNPSWSEWVYTWIWNLSAGISDVNPVESAVGLLSLPNFFVDKWVSGTPGWIHTSYDNSTSTTTLNWVEISDLENPLKVVALSLARIVEWKGDINGDGIVNLFDLTIVGTAWDSKPGDENWNPNADLDNDGWVYLPDLTIIGTNYEG